MSEETTRLLIVRYLAGELTPEEARGLSVELRRSLAAREWMREISIVAVAVADLAAARGRVVPEEAPRPRGLRPALAWAAATAGMALATLGALYFTAPPAVLEVMAVQGAAVWTDAGGTRRVELACGARLAAGGIEIANDLSNVELRFADGSVFTLAGRAEATVADDAGKRIHLTRGRLSARVAPQQAGQPLRIRTATADLEAVGARFALEVQADLTRLAVAEGRVRMRRTVDGQETDVAAEHQASASLDARMPLAMSPRGALSATWRMDFSQPRPETSGEWRGNAPPRLAAVPFVAKRRAEADGTLALQYGLSVRGWHVAALEPNSVLRVRLRVQRPVAVQLMLSTWLASGDFGGNFDHVLARTDTAPPDNWRTVEVRLSEFRAIHPQVSASPAGNSLGAVVMTTYDQQAGLEVVEISLAPAPVP
jgi:ferric-dicitrate binding protein FerR (iron transport regulator)